MSTETQSQTINKTILGQNVLDTATNIWQEIQAIYVWAGQRFPYNVPKLRTDLGQILLWDWDMASMIVIQFYSPDMVEKLSYEFVPGVAPDAEHSEPGTFPRYALDPSWQVRVIAKDSLTKPQSEVKNFFRELGWLRCDPLTRTGEGTTEQYGSFKSGDYGVTRQVYSDPDKKDYSNGKELVPHENT
jgi:hypothetical protein